MRPFQYTPEANYPLQDSQESGLSNEQAMASTFFCESVSGVIFMLTETGALSITTSAFG